ncbi:ATP-NAD kinase family protein [Pyrofollis japonicus]|uniref:ATP-NAD kinase family protein n=1 Tax=Pyrofollis japonicus TaxID=3060460 RepID=UPI00295BF69A|nr:ATP-NAD kinase family protein [Pyrofollis japonicus]BEP17595.1 ATP-NAD kinase family protein [Pyrofollis japonicus]
MKRRVCFVVNPLAGIGGPLALKGSDGEAALIALRKGAKLVAPSRALTFLRKVKELGLDKDIEFLTASDLMGEELLKEVSIQDFQKVYTYSVFPTSPKDTINTVRNCIINNADLVVFVGGDGTARDIVDALRSANREEIPLLGVPGGVKMYSSVFAENPEAAANALLDWVRNPSTCDAEILDIDEDAFRRGELRVKLYGYVKTPCSRYLVGSSKQPSLSTLDEEENKEAIARYVVENMEECTLYIVGPGTTTKKIADILGLPKTVLGVDVYHDKEVVALDVDEETLYNIVKKHIEKGGKAKIIVTPIGGQGYILGRGNQQISPRIVKLARPKNIIVIATRSKLSRLRKLRVDTGDPELDQLLRGYVRVIVDYGEEHVMPVD